VLRIVFLALLPIFIWMLISGYKQFIAEHEIKNEADFVSRIVWLISLLFAVVTSFTMVFFNASITATLKYW
jgi:hypothetical protein